MHIPSEPAIPVIGIYPTDIPVQHSLQLKKETIKVFNNRRLMELIIHIYTMEFNTTSKKNENLGNFLRFPSTNIVISNYMND